MRAFVDRVTSVGFFAHNSDAAETLGVIAAGEAADGGTAPRRAPGIRVAAVCPGDSGVRNRGGPRLYPTWPVMTPWTAMCLAALGAATLTQLGHPFRGRVWVARGLALAVVVFAVVVLAE
jgi:hypothetical protein